MSIRQRSWWMGLALVMLLTAGCSGVLLQNFYDDGHVERLKVDGVSTWKIYDKNPTKQDDSGLILKREATF